MAWKYPTSPVAKKFKCQPSAGMLTVFCDMEGAILVHFTPKGPDLAPSNFHMFGPMKVALRGRRFSSSEEVIGAVQNRLKTQSKKKILTEFKKKTCEILEPMR
jgi:hypothetical protein